MQPLSDNRFEPLEGKNLRNKVALMGGELQRFDTTARYMDWQFHQRIIPRRMENTQDRQRYYRMLETSLYGGLSSELQKGLRDYLLPADDKVKTSINSMQSALQDTRNTRNKIEDTRRHRQMVKSVLKSSYELGEYVLATSAKNHRRLKDELNEKRREEDRARDSLDTKKQQLLAINARLSSFESHRSELEFQEDEAQTRMEDARELQRLHNDQQRLEDEASNNRQHLEELNEHQQLMTTQLEEQEASLSILEEDVSLLVAQLSSVEQTYSEEARKAGLYQAAMRSLNDVREAFNEPALDASELAERLAYIQKLRQQQSLEFHQQQPLLEQAEFIEAHFNIALTLLSQLDNQPVSPQQVADRTDHWLQHSRDQQRTASTLASLQQALRKRQDEDRQLHKLQQALKNLPEFWSNQIHDESSWDTCLKRLEEEQKNHQIRLEELQQKTHQQQQQRQTLMLEFQQARKDHLDWSSCQNTVRAIHENDPAVYLSSSDDYQQLRQTAHQQQRQLLQDDSRLEKDLVQLRQRLRKLEMSASEELLQLQRLAELTGGTVISDYFDNDDISLEEAAWLEAKFGPLRHAIKVSDITLAARLIRAETDKPEHVWLLSGEAGDSFSEDDYLTVTDEATEDSNVLVNLSNNIARLSQEPEFPTIGRLAREKEQHRLQQLEEDILDQRQELAVQQRMLDKRQQLLDQLAPLHIWLDQPEPPVTVIEQKLEALLISIEALQQSGNLINEQRISAHQSLQILNRWQTSAWLLNDDPTRISASDLASQANQANAAQEWLTTHQDHLRELEQRRLHLQQPPAEDLEALKSKLASLKQQLSELGLQQNLLEDALNKAPDLRFCESLSHRDETENVQNTLKQEHQKKEQQRQKQSAEVNQLKVQSYSQQMRIAEEKTRLDEKHRSLHLLSQQIKDIPLTWEIGLEDYCRQQLTDIRTEKTELDRQVTALNKESVLVAADKEQIEKHLSNTIADIKNLEPRSAFATEINADILAAQSLSGLKDKLHIEHLLLQDSDQLNLGLANALAQLQKALDTEQESSLYQFIASANIKNLKSLFEGCLESQRFLSERMDKTLVQSDDPRQALDQLEAYLTRLETLLEDAEKRFLAESDHLGRTIQRRINMERKKIHQLNSALSSVYFGTIRAIKIELEVVNSYQKVLDALQQHFYADLFQQPDMSVEQALEKLFKRETGGTIVGEKLLDYREYISLRILIKRAGSHQYEAANPTNMSTGEAIGTGLAVLTIVLHSWEVATENKYQFGHCANRLLFLDEAARLDARALATLEELCSNQSLQLLVGAPDNVLPKNGVTYRMVRLMDPYEHVIFSAVRGKLPGTADATDV